MAALRADQAKGLTLTLWAASPMLLKLHRFTPAERVDLHQAQLWAKKKGKNYSPDSEKPQEAGGQAQGQSLPGVCHRRSDEPPLSPRHLSLEGTAEGCCPGARIVCSFPKVGPEKQNLKILVGGMRYLKG